MILKDIVIIFSSFILLGIIINGLIRAWNTDAYDVTGLKDDE